MIFVCALLLLNVHAFAVVAVDVMLPLLYIIPLPWLLLLPFSDGALDIASTLHDDIRPNLTLESR